jgi:glycosyltransferase involved in cell wall biosynthesis
MQPVRVAWLQPSLQPYRIPLLSLLARSDAIELTLFTTKDDAEVAHRYGDIVLGSDVQLEGVASWDIKRGRPRTLFQGGFVKVLSGRFEVVVLSDTIHNLSNWLYWVVSFFGGPRIMFFGYGLRPVAMRAGIGGTVRRSLQRLLLSRGSSFAAYTAAGRDALLRLGIDDEQIFVLSNTLDTSYLTSLSSPDARDELTPRLALRPGLPILLFVGRMQTAKRLDVLIDAVRHLEETGTEVELVLIGDGPELEASRKRAEGIEGVHFLSQEYDPRALAPFFAAADILAIPGRVGLTCVHGFAYGLPCITVAATEVEQSPEFEYIEDGVNGFVVAEPDPSLYAAAIGSALRDREVLARMESACLETAERLSMEHMASTWEQAVVEATERG